MLLNTTTVHASQTVTLSASKMKNETTCFRATEDFHHNNSKLFAYLPKPVLMQWHDIAVSCMHKNLKQHHEIVYGDSLNNQHYDMSASLSCLLQKRHVIIHYYYYNYLVRFLITLNPVVSFPLPFFQNILLLYSQLKPTKSDNKD